MLITSRRRNKKHSSQILAAPRDRGGAVTKQPASEYDARTMGKSAAEIRHVQMPYSPTAASKLSNICQGDRSNSSSPTTVPLAAQPESHSQGTRTKPCATGCKRTGVRLVHWRSRKSGKCRLKILHRNANGVSNLPTGNDATCNDTDTAIAPWFSLLWATFLGVQCALRQCLRLTMLSRRKLKRFCLCLACRKARGTLRHYLLLAAGRPANE